MEFVLLAVVILFFCGPLLNMLMLTFANAYTAPAVLSRAWGLKWWNYIFAQESLLPSVVRSFVAAVITTLGSMLWCITAAYSIARFKCRSRKPHPAEGLGAGYAGSCGISHHTMKMAEREEPAAKWDFQKFPSEKIWRSAVNDTSPYFFR